MAEIIVDFEALKAKAIKESLKYFSSPQQPDITFVEASEKNDKESDSTNVLECEEFKNINFYEACRKIDDETEYYKSSFLEYYEDLIDAGDIASVIKECSEEHKDWMDGIKLMRSNNGGARYNDIASLGINKSANDFCFHFFLAQLNLSILKSVNNQNQIINADSPKKTEFSIKEEPTSFDKYLTESGKLLIPFIAEKFEGARPKELAKLLYALQDLGFLNTLMPLIGHQEKVFYALQRLLGQIGVRTSFNDAVNRYGSPTLSQEDEIKFIREQIKFYISDNQIVI